MPKMRTLRVVDPTFLDNAPVTDQLQQSLPVSAEAAFRCLEDGDAWSEWIDGIESVDWTSPKPYGIGTTRTVHLKPGPVEEEFFAWEDGRRMAFYFVRASIPVFGAFAEDYVLEPRGEDGCLLTWRWGLEGGGPFKFGPLQSLVNVGFKRAGRKSLAELERYLRANGDKYAG